MVFLTSFQITDNYSKEVKISWSLDPRVNILVGRNGTGKTTLLNYIYNTIYFFKRREINPLTTSDYLKRIFPLHLMSKLKRRSLLMNKVKRRSLIPLFVQYS